MAEPLRIRFATDTAKVKSGMQDLAATVVSNMVKVSGTIVANAEVAGAAAGKVGQAFGTGARGVANAATTITRDATAIGAAGLKAANDTNVSAIAISAAMGKAAAGTKTASVATEAAFAALAAKASFTWAIVRNEVAGTVAAMRASPLATGAGIAAIGAGAGLVVFFGALSAAVAKAHEQLDQYVAIAARAKDLDVGTSFLQAFRDQAGKLKLDIKDLEAALDNFRKGSQVSLDTGSSTIRARLSDIFRSGYTADSRAVTAYDQAKDEEGRIRAVLQAMRELRDVGNEIAMLDLAEKAFGDKLTQGLRSGKVDLDEFVRKLDDVKIPPEAIASAEELRKRLDEAHQVLKDWWNTSMVNLEPAAQALLLVWVNIVETIGKGVKVLEAFAAAGAKVVAQDLSDLRRIYGAISNMGRPIASPDSPSNYDEILRARRQGYSGPASEPGERSRPYPFWDQPGYVPSDERRRPSVPPQPADPFPGAGLPPRRPLNLQGDDDKPKGGSSPSDSQDQVESFIQSLERSAAALKAETEAYGKSNEEKQKAIALARGEEIAKQRGSELTEEEIRKLTAVGAAAGAARDRLALLQQKSQQTAEAFRALGDAAVDSLYGMIAEGRTAADVMDNLQKMLIKAALQASIMGTGPLAGLFGTAAAPGATGAASVGGLVGLGATSLTRLFGYAEGGYTGPGGKYDPRGIVHAGEYVIPAEDVQRLGVGGIEAFLRLPGFAKGGLVGMSSPSVPNFMAASGGSVAIDLGGTKIDARGSSMSEGQLLALLAANNKALEARLGSLVKDLVVRGRIR